jgi:uncharacterized protein
VQAVAAAKIKATTTVETVQEFVHVRSRRRPREDACDLGIAYVELLSPLLSPGRAELEEGLRLFRASDRLGAFDAVLAASALLAGAQALVSADSAFADLSGLVFVNPADPQALARLGLQPED